MVKRGVLTFLKFIILMISGVIINLFVHELSHLALLMICNGKFDSFSFGLSMFVGGYVDAKYISLVAMSSLVIPTIFTILLDVFNKPYVRMFTCGMVIPNIMNAVLGFIYLLFSKDETTKNTFDIIIAYNNTNLKFVIVLVSAICLIINIFVIFNELNFFYKEDAFYDDMDDE